MNEDLWEDNTEVISHQKKDGKHRLVLCRRPRQYAGNWVSADQIATVGDYQATYLDGVKEMKLYQRNS